MEMSTFNKRGEIRSFTDQVRVICVKNDIDKPTLGVKIGLDNNSVFTAIKNNTFKPSPESYFKLEKVICGKDEHYRSKLRSKYEKTLVPSELSDYTKILGKIKELEKPSLKSFKQPVQKTGRSSEKNLIKAIKTGSVIDKESRKKMYEILKANLPEGVSMSRIDRIAGSGRVFNLKYGATYIPVEKLAEIIKICSFEEGSEIHSKLLDLELSCIAGSNENEELKKFENFFEKKGKTSTPTIKPSAMATVSKPQETAGISKVTDEANYETEKKEFGNILTKWLFMNGYNFVRAADSIGCSEQEFTKVISGEICLSPYHVNRFKETLKMDEDTISKLIEISNKCYKGHEVPKDLLSYISSDSAIIDALEKIRMAHKGVSFWQEILKKI